MAPCSEEAAREAWLDRNTFRCALGRVTPAQCEATRRKPGWLGKARKSPSCAGHWETRRPPKCDRCTDHERLIREFRERRKDDTSNVIANERPDVPIKPEETMSEQAKQVKTGSKGMVLCPLCNDGILKKHGGFGLCPKHYMRKYNEIKKERRRPPTGGSKTRPIDPKELGGNQPITPEQGIADLFDSPADVELRSWLVADMRAERRNRLEDHILYILDVYRAGKINQEAGR